MEPASPTSEPVVADLVRRHGGRLMAVARRYSSSREDAEDAYQRAVEILLRRPPTHDPTQLLPWMKTVVKHEAFAVRRQRMRHGTPSEAERIEPLAGLAQGTAELAERRERLRLGAEALGRLKPQEVRALLLRAEGLSYREICNQTGWSYTKVNRCLAEGRRSFLRRVAGIEGGAECERLRPLVSALADGEASAEDLAALRPHLRGCLACRARLREYRGAPAAAALVAPAGMIGWLVGVARDAAAGWGGVAQALGAHKVAAVVASTAVVAGGGAAVVVPERPGRAEAERPAARREAARPVVPAPQSGGAARVPAPSSQPARPARRSHRRSGPAQHERQQLREGSGGEFAPQAAPPPPTGPPAAPRPAPAPRAPTGGEFAP